MGESRQNTAGDHQLRGQLLRRILVSASALGLLTVGGKVLGLLEKLCQARVLGTSAELDAYLVAISIPTSMYVFTREVIEPSVLPIYLNLRQDAGLREARRFATTVGLVILAVTGILITPILLQLDRSIRILAPGLDDRTVGLSVQLGYAALPAGLLLSLSALTAITLNAHKRFVLPASGEFAQKAVLAVAFCLVVCRLGIASIGPAFALACIARLTVHIVGIARTGGTAPPFTLRHPAIIQALKLASPLILGMIFSQVGALADNHYGSRMGPGVISALSFGRKLVDLPLLVVSYSISVVVFPYFADLHIQNDREGSLHLLRKLLRLTMILFAWASAVTIPLARDVVRVVFEGGAFGSRSVEMTTPILAWYAIGFVPLAVESILVQHFFARRDVIRPVAAGIAAVVIHVAIVAASWSWLGPRSIAAAYVVAKSLKVVFLLYSSSVWRSSFTRESAFLLRLLAVGIASGVLVMKASAMPSVVLWPPLIRVALLAAVATVAFGAGSYLLRIIRFTRISPS